MALPAFDSPAEVVQAASDWPHTAAEPVRATVTVYPHCLEMYLDGVERATVCRGKVDVVDFYRRDDQ